MYLQCTVYVHATCTCTQHCAQESDEHRQQQREAEEMLRQTEEDTDQEILQLKNKYEWQLRKRQEECTKLKGELGLRTKKVNYNNSMLVNVL